MSTTEIGDRFRDQVAELLRAAGYVATAEILEGHKRIDVIFESTTFGKRRRYALEAKNWQDPLDHSDLERIYAGHASFVMTREIDELLVVSPQELRSPAAKAFVRDTPGISHLSFKQFQESIMGFQEYLATFIYNHESDGLERYFVDPLLEDGTSLESHIENWIDSDRTEPIAIIASYGMGKTSFARHLAYRFASRFVSGEACRVPILVSLGAIAREQSLEGLIGSVLAGTKPSVTNYNFPLFYHLNTIGRFLILLDGFDEMKHMMTWSEFQSNFDELNRLAKGKSKVLLLGRPTVFLSDNERAFVLRGTQRIGKSALQTPGAPKYTEITLSPFSADQIRRFVHAYLSHHQVAGNIKATPEFIARRQKEIDDKSQEALLSRPVHARMIADIATDPTVEISGLSRFALYDHFVDHLIQRELKKPGRGKLYKANDRRSFACDLAWYLWGASASAGIGCRLDDLPDSLFAPYLPKDEDVNSSKRALLSGSFLDEKAGGVFFFSHRSFQEFLVAEYIWDLAGADTLELEIDLATHNLTQEVFDFLIERDDRGFFRALGTAIGKCKPDIPLDFLRIAASSSVMREISSQRSRAFFSTVDAAILFAHAFMSKETNITESIRHVARLTIEKADQKPQVILSAILFVLIFSIEKKIDRKFIAKTIVSLLFARAKYDLDNLMEKHERRTSSDIMSDIIFECVSAETHPNAGLLMSVSLAGLCNAILENVAFPTSKRYLDPILPETYTARFNVFFAEVPEVFYPSLRTFFRRDADVAKKIDESGG